MYMTEKEKMLKINQVLGLLLLYCHCLHLFLYCMRMKTLKKTFLQFADLVHTAEY